MLKAHCNQKKKMKERFSARRKKKRRRATRPRQHSPRSLGNGMENQNMNSDRGGSGPALKFSGRVLAGGPPAHLRCLEL